MGANTPMTKETQKFIREINKMQRRQIMYHNTYHIEKTFGNSVCICVKYSETVQSGTIKIRRTGAPNMKWTFEEKNKGRYRLCFY